MAGTSSVPRPVLGPAGFSAPQPADVLAGVLADLNAAFGGNLNIATLETPQGQLASTLCAIIADKNDAFRYYVSQVDPATAQGRMQDGIARIYFLTRKPARPTAVAAVCRGLPGTVIPSGAAAADSAGRAYVCTAGGAISSQGTVSLPFACATPGPIACPALTLNTITLAIPGWDSISNPGDGVVGADVESAADFEARRGASVARNAQGTLDSIRALVLDLPDVLDCYAAENTQGFAVVQGGVTLKPHSIYIAVAGGDPDAIAHAIWTRKAPGCDYTGNTTVSVPDTSYAEPWPSYDVTYQVPDPVPLLVRVTLAQSAAVPSDAAAQVQTAVTAAFAGQDSGPRARIGGAVRASRFYAGIAALGGWAQIISVEVGLGQAFGPQAALRIDQMPTIAPGNVTLVLA